MLKLTINRKIKTIKYSPFIENNTYLDFNNSILIDQRNNQFIIQNLKNPIFKSLHSNFYFQNYTMKNSEIPYL